MSPGEGAPGGAELVLGGVQSWAGLGSLVSTSSWPGEDYPAEMPSDLPVLMCEDTLKVLLVASDTRLSLVPV